MLGLLWDAPAIQAQFCNGLAGCNILISLAHKLPFLGSTKDSKCQVSFHLGSGWRLAQRCNTEVASVCTSCRSGWAGRAWLDTPSATGGDAWRPALALADTGLSTHTCALSHACVHKLMRSVKRPSDLTMKLGVLASSQSPHLFRVVSFTNGRRFLVESKRNHRRASRG